MNKAICKSCGAPIVWIPTAAGRAAPCDPNPVYYRRKDDSEKEIVTIRGKIVSCEIVAATEAEGAGYAPHTCQRKGGAHK